MLIVAIPALLLLLFAFSFLSSSTSQILKPNSVRKGWDSLNVLLVIFAIVCGVFARWNEDAGGNTNKDLETPVEQVSNDIPLEQTTSPTSSYELRWYELSYESQMRTTASGSGGLRRNSTSYPDLRQQSDWETTGGHGFRYYDDFEISRFNQSIEKQPNGIVGRGITRRNGDPDAKVIQVVTFPSQTDLAAKSPSLRDNPPSQPPRPPPTTQQKKSKVHRSVPKRERSGIENAPRVTHQQPQKEDKGSSNPIKTGLPSQTKPRRRKVRRGAPVKEEIHTRSASESSSNLAPPHSPPSVHPTIPVEQEYIQRTPPEPKATRKEIEIITVTEAAQFSSQSLSPPPAPPPLPPPPTPTTTIIRPDQNQKVSKKEMKKSSAKKEIAMVWASIYKRKKKQNQQQQQQLTTADSGNYNGISQLFYEPEPEYTSTSQLLPPPSPAPPPPPPPPPRSVFHSLFKKSGTSKSKKIHSVPAPPPPHQSFSAIPPPQDNSSQPPSTGGKPPLPKRPSNYTKSGYGYVNNSGSQSPLFDIPRPPPLPPFGVPDTKFVVRGDYAKIKSNASSRSGSPEPYVFDDDDDDDESLINESVSDDVVRTTPCCPSPDVNAKADTFIARLRGEWRLEKMNSVNVKTTRMGLDLGEA